MQIRRRSYPALGFVLPTLALAGCSVEPPAGAGVDSTASAVEALTRGEEQPAAYEVTVPWGQEPGQLRLHRSRVAEDPTAGPNAVAVAPTGAALLLDQLGERVLAVGADGAPLVVTTAPRDAALLVAGADGAFVTWSRVRARAWFFEPSGAAAGELPVARSFMLFERLSIGASRRLLLHSDGQDTVALGTPRAPIPEPVARLGRRAGAAELPDGRGLFVHVADGRGALLLLAQPDRKHERPRVEARHELPGEITAARIVGAHQSTTCLRVERVEPTVPIAVERRALCVDARSGAVLFDAALPPPGLYAPETELAMNEGRLAFIQPNEEGLRVMGWRVPVVPAKEVEP